MEWIFVDLTSADTFIAAALFIKASFLSLPLTTPVGAEEAKPVGAGEAKFFGFIGSYWCCEREKEERKLATLNSKMCKLEPNPPESIPKRAI